MDANTPEMMSSEVSIIQDLVSYLSSGVIAYNELDETHNPNFKNLEQWCKINAKYNKLSGRISVNMIWKLQEERPKANVNFYNPTLGPSNFSQVSSMWLDGMPRERVSWNPSIMVLHEKIPLLP